MRIPSDAGSTVEITNWKSRLVSTIVTILGLAGTSLAESISTPWQKNAFLAFATTLIAIGSLSLLFDIALRRNLYNEVIRLVGIQKSIIEGQLVSLGSSRIVDWSLILSARSYYKFILVEPAGWFEQNFHTILESAKIRAVSIEIYLPDPRSTYVAALAQSLNAEPAAYTVAIDDFCSKIERIWVAKHKESQLTSGSIIAIKFLTHAPLHTLVIADDCTLLAITGALGRETADADFCYIHVGNKDAHPSAWFNKQITRLAQQPIRYESRV